MFEFIGNFISNILFYLSIISLVFTVLAMALGPKMTRPEKGYKSFEQISEEGEKWRKSLPPQ